MPYDAFISYSHGRDFELAADLQSALESIAKPWYRLRALRIFRDKSTLAASPRLWGALEAALDESEFLILLASENTADSEWVDRELEYWLEHKSPDNILLALESGDIVWDAAKLDYDWDKSTGLPRRLSGVFRDEPLYVDFTSLERSEGKRSKSPQFTNAVGELVAAIQKTTKDAILGEHLRQHRRTIRLAWSVAGGVSVLAVGLAFSVYTALLQRDEAIRQSALSRSRELAAQSQVALNEDRRQSLELAAMATEAAFTPEAFGTLLTALQASAGMRAIIPAAQGNTKAPATLFAPDGRLVWSNNGKLYAWDLDCSNTPTAIGSVGLDAKELRLLPGGNHVLAVAGGNFELLDLGSKEPIRSEIGRRAGFLSAVAVSADGSQFAVGHRSNVVSVWNGRDGTPLLELKGHLGPIEHLAFSPNGALLVVADGAIERRVRLWNLIDTPPSFADLPSLEQSVGGVAFSASGKRLLVGAAQLHVFNISDPAQPQRIQDISGLGSVTALTIGLGEHVVTGHGNGSIVVWRSSDSGQLIRVTDFEHGASVEHLWSHPDISLIVAAGGPQWRSVHVSANSMLRGPLGASRFRVERTAISKNGSYLATSAGTGRVAVWDASTPYVVGSTLAYAPNGQALVSGRLKQVLLWRNQSAQPMVLEAHLAPVKAVAVSPDARWAASGGFDEALRLWDLQADVTGEWLYGEPVQKSSQFEGNPGVEAIAFSHDGRHLAWAFNEHSSGESVWSGFVRVWDLEQRQFIGSLNEHPSFISALAFSADGASLILGGHENDAMIWNILESRELRRLQGHRNWVNHLAVSEGGRLVATAGEDASILLWDFATGKSLSRPLTGHTSSVNAVAFDSEGKLLASGDSSGNLLIWTLGDAVRRIAAVRVPGPILQLTFAPDGLHLAVLRQPGVLDLVPVDVPFMQAEARRIRECGRGR